MKNYLRWKGGMAGLVGFVAVLSSPGCIDGFRGNAIFPGYGQPRSSATNVVGRPGDVFVEKVEENGN